MVAAAIVGGAVIGGVASNMASSKASKTAANAQMESTNASISAQQAQFNAMKDLLRPYSQAGTGSPSEFNSQKYLAENPDVASDPYWSQDPLGHWLQYGQNEGRKNPGMTAGTKGSLGAQQDLLGLNGNAAQKAAIDSIQNSSQFTALAQQGENGILQNASATGGLRGGNTQAALMQFRPQLLNQMINDQYTKLGGMTSIGQNAAAGTGNAGMQSANNISGLLQQAGASQAGLALAQGRNDANMYSTLGNAFGTYAGMGGFNSNATTTTTTAAPASDVAGFGGSGSGNGISGSMF